MPYTVNIQDWMAQRQDEIIEIPKLSISEQLERYDSSETGIGFILVLCLMTMDDSGTPTNYDVLSMPVVKIRGEWLTINDENLADILAGVVRMVAPANEVANGDAR